MTRFETGDVIRVPFPFIERNQRRSRPALVVSGEPVGPDDMLVWALMITNSARARWPGDVEIIEWEAAGLPIPSIVRTAKIATLEMSSAEPIGRIADGELHSVRLELGRLLRL